MSKEILFEDSFGTGSFYYKSKVDSSKNEYFFSTSRKGYNHYGLVIRIINDRFPTKKEKDNTRYTDDNITISINEFDGNNVTNFMEHIEIIGVRKYFMSQETPDMRNYVYSGTEILIFTTSSLVTGKIGQFITEECVNLLKQQFSVIMYSADGLFALFCAIEGVNRIDNAYKYLALKQISFFVNEINPYLELNIFSKGIEVQDFFNDYQFKILDEKENLILIDPFYFEYERKYIEIEGVKRFQKSECFSCDRISQTRLLKISNFKNTNADWWIVFNVKESENLLTAKNALEYIHDKFNIVS
jgi:hypothetical protein